MTGPPRVRTSVAQSKGNRHSRCLSTVGQGMFFVEDEFLNFPKLNRITGFLNRKPVDYDVVQGFLFVAVMV